MNEAAGPTLVYFAERRADMDHAAFVRRWRAHGALGMSLPRWRNVARYVQCDALHVPTGLRPIACDGIALVGFRSEAARLAHAADPDGAITRADEEATFAAPVRASATVCEEVAWALREARLSLFLAVRRREGIADADFRARWINGHGAAAAARLEGSGLGLGFVQRFASPAASRPPRFAFDALDEVRSDGPPEGLPLGLVLGREAAELLGAVEALWTAPAVLHENHS